MPTDMSRYPDGWKHFSYHIRMERAQKRCECQGECGLHSEHPGPRRCTELHGQDAKYAKGKVVLTTAHLCECDPLCKNPDHVKACCQRCHLRIDVKLHQYHRHRNRRLKKESAGQMKLILEG